MNSSAPMPFPNLVGIGAAAHAFKSGTDAGGPRRHGPN